MSKRAWLLLAAAIGLATWFAFFRQSDEARIRATLGQLATSLEDRPAEAMTARAQRIQAAFVRVFSPKVHVQVGPAQVDDRASLVLAAVGAQEALRQHPLAFELESVKVAADRKAARVTLNVHAGGLDDEDGGARLVTVVLEKDGDWRIVSATAALGE